MCVCGHTSVGVTLLHVREYSGVVPVRYLLIHVFGVGHTTYSNTCVCMYVYMWAVGVLNTWCMPVSTSTSMCIV